MQDNHAEFTVISKQYHPLLVSMTGIFLERGRSYNLDRDEIFQEAQIALYNAHCTYNSKQTDVTFGLYAKVCVRNRLVSMLRKAKRSTQVSLPSPPPEPRERELAKAQLAQLRTAVEDKLTFIERAALGGYLAGLSYREIAAKHGCSAKAIDNALWRVKKKMRGTVT